MKKMVLPVMVLSSIVLCSNTSEGSQNSEGQIKDYGLNKQEFYTEITGNKPLVNNDLGDFPFFSFPEGLKSMNKPIERKYDVIYFPINGVMTPKEGRIFKANVTTVNRKTDEWSLAFFLKSYDNAILAAGGRKIFDGQISKEEYNRFSKEATYLGEGGSIGYTKEVIKVYLITKEDGKNIYIQLTGNSASGKLNILQEEGFKQTITKITSDHIVKDLTEKGKSILYINFAVDKSNITTEGNDVIGQIAEALKKDSSLKIAIEGHTDNTGNADHNKKLSDERANAVLNALVSQNIDKSRLSAKGFGAEQPLVANDSDENRAKNRRVELVKTN